MPEKSKYVFALAGNPNCGKTTLFNSLTGATATVGNWPGVTVEKRAGTYKNKDIGTADIVDLPGIYSLSPYTPEEVVSRNFILDEHPDCVIDVVDATNLERNMYLTTQILEMDVPVIIALNMMDALRANGQDIDCKKLSERLKVPVVPVSALKFENLDNLMKEAIEAAKTPRNGTSILLEGKNKDVILKAKSIYIKDWVPNPLYHAIKDLEGDDIEQKHHPFEFKQVNVLVPSSNDFEQESSDQRYRFIDNELGTCVIGISKENPIKPTKTDKADKILTSRIWGLPIFVVILFLIFHITFSNDLLFLKAMGAFGSKGIVSFVGTPFEGLFADGGIASLGVFMSNLVNDLTGWFTEWLRSVITVSWAQGLVCDGICSGVFAVFGFLPQILLLFACFSILEDSGYMARVAFILDRIFRRFGLNGRAFVPMLIGFEISPAMAAFITLTFYGAAFYAEIIRGRIVSIDAGQWDAGRAIGMRRGQLMGKIILPQALRRMVPPLVNQSVLQLKNTSLLSVLAVPDLLYQGQLVTSATYRPLETYTLIAVLYLAVLFPLTRLAHGLEGRLK